MLENITERERNSGFIGLFRFGGGVVCHKSYWLLCKAGVQISTTSHRLPVPGNTSAYNITLLTKSCFMENFNIVHFNENSSIRL